MTGGTINLPFHRHWQKIKKEIKPIVELLQKQDKTEKNLEYKRKTTAVSVDNRIERQHNCPAKMVKCNNCQK